MFNEKMTEQDKKVYVNYLRLVEILTTDEYGGMYEKIGAIEAKIRQINEIIDDE